MVVTDPWVLVVLFALIAGVNWLTAREVMAEDSRRWPTTEGVIVRLRRRRSRVWPSGRMLEYPAVEYEYIVDGRTYNGSRISLGVARERQVQFTEGYVEGGKVVVHYRPDKPDFAVLIPGGSAVRKWFLESGFPLFVLALAGMVLVLVLLRILGR